MTYTADNYRDGLVRLLPSGPAWKGKRKGGWLYKLLTGLSKIFGRVDAGIDELWQETFINTPDKTLADWERAFGLPDPCITQAQSASQRLAAIHARALANPEVVPDSYYVAVIAALGGTAYIRNFRPSNPKWAYAGMPAQSQEWHFYRTIDIVDVAASGVVAEQISCNIEKIEHGYVKTRFHYLALPLIDGFEDPSWYADTDGKLTWRRNDGLTKQYWTIDGVSPLPTIGLDAGKIDPGQAATELRQLYVDVGALAAGDSVSFSLTNAAVVLGMSQVSEAWFRPAIVGAAGILRLGVHVRKQAATSYRYFAVVDFDANAATQTWTIYRADSSGVNTIDTGALAFAGNYDDPLGVRLYVTDTGTADQCAVRLDVNDNGAGWVTQYDDNDSSAADIFGTTGVPGFDVGQKTGSTPHADDRAFVDDWRGHSSI